MKKITTLFFASIMSLVIFSYLFSQQYDDLQEKPVNNDRLKLFPVEGKNYFFLQSIDNETRIVIGDFTQIDKKIILINLKDDYITIKSVIEYIPAKNEMRVLSKSDSRFFTTDMTKLKKDIITGEIFKGNYAEGMKSYGELERVFKQNELSKIFPEVYGFSVKLDDIDGKKFRQCTLSVILQRDTICSLKHIITGKIQGQKKYLC